MCEFYVTEDNKPEYNIIYKKNIDGTEIINGPTSHLIDYLESQGVNLDEKNFDGLTSSAPDPFNNNEVKETVNQVPITPTTNQTQTSEVEEIL